MWLPLLTSHSVRGFRICSYACKTVGKSAADLARSRHSAKQAASSMHDEAPYTFVRTISIGHGFSNSPFQHMAALHVRNHQPVQLVHLGNAIEAKEEPEIASRYSSLSDLLGSVASELSVRRTQTFSSNFLDPQEYTIHPVCRLLLLSQSIYCTCPRGRAYSWR